MEHILVIEDDPAIRDLLRRGLTYETTKSPPPTTARPVWRPPATTHPIWSCWTG